MEIFLNYIWKSTRMSGLEPDLRVCYFTARLQRRTRVKTNHVCSDDMVEKELDIKLDITKKSRRINRPVQFADQHGELLDIISWSFWEKCWCQVTSWRRWSPTVRCRPSTSPGILSPGSSSVLLYSPRTRSPSHHTDLEWWRLDFINISFLLQVNTIRADFISQGMNHSEGGWPKVAQSTL